MKNSFHKSAINHIKSDYLKSFLTKCGQQVGPEGTPADCWSTTGTCGDGESMAPIEGVERRTCSALATKHLLG